MRWETPDEDFTYDASALDRAVVARDQIQLIVRTFRDRLFTEIFPGRTEVPKTLIFAKDDSHAEDIVEVVRQEFGRGNEFCQKITYKTTGRKPADLIQDFRNSYNPRIAVTVDMVATGTDIRPIEVVVFMRSVKSRVLFEQMKGRGVRVIDTTELKAVTPDAQAKTHFVIVDAVGICEAGVEDSCPLERKKSVPFKTLLEHVAVGGTDPEVLSSLASRLARLDKRCGPDERSRIAAESGGLSLGKMTHDIVDALDPDVQAAEARSVVSRRGGYGHVELCLVTTLLAQRDNHLSTGTRKRFSLILDCSHRGILIGNGQFRPIPRAYLMASPVPGFVRAAPWQ
jgi:type I restriction enzyme R subunit